MPVNEVAPDTRPYERYVGELANFVGRVREVGTGGMRIPISHAVNGQANDRLQSLVPLADRRLAGAFFTSSRLVMRAIRPWRATFSHDAKILDPACGAGDLLLGCARLLPVAEDWTTTLEQWGGQLFGFDTSQEFVEAARLRLALLAASRTGHVGGLAHDQEGELFPNIKVGDGLSARRSDEVTHVILNPPFGRREAPEDCSWGSGTISSAALFVDSVLTHAQLGTEIVAILPDVLRAGTRYSEWRSRVETLTNIRSLRIHGAFDASADVDVFIIRMEVAAEPGPQTAKWWRADPPTQRCVSDRFEVRVGSVVPHRDPNSGRWHPFATARSLLPWQVTASSSLKRRRFNGTTLKPPFVAVRRTSSPRDKHRATASIVEGSEPVAVENHLIALSPRDGTLRACRELLISLQLDTTDDWLNNRIRCRHLTVGAVADLPLMQS